MKSKVLVVVALASSLFLCACQPSATSSQTSEVTPAFAVTFHARHNGVDPIVIAADASGKISENEALQSVEKGYDNHIFQGWFLSQDAAKSLDKGDGDANLFSFATTLSASLDVYAGYSLANWSTAVDERLGCYLGVYESLGYSPLPVIEASSFELDESKDCAFTAAGVTSSSYAAYGDKLTAAGFSKASEGVYLDPLGNYNVTLSYADGAASFLISFADAVGAFPAKYLSSLTSGYTLSTYLSESTFELAANEKDEDLSKRFITYTASTGVGESSKIAKKYVFYTPKSTDETPAASLGAYLKSHGFQSVSSTRLLYCDPFGTVLLYPSIYQGSNDFAFASLPLQKGMVCLSATSLYSTSLDVDELKSAYRSYSGAAYPENKYPDLSGLGTSFGAIFGYSNSSGEGPGFAICGANKDKFDAVLSSLYKAGWQYSSSTSTYSTAFAFLDPSQQYQINMTYYDSGKVGGLMSDIIQVTLFHYQSFTDKLSTWLGKQNQGGGTLSELPSLPKDTTSGSVNSSYPYYFQFSVTSFNVSADNDFLAALVAAGWKKTTTKNDIDYYDYSDGRYQLVMSYSATNQKLTAILVYITDSVVTTGYADVMSAFAKRLGVTTLAVPGFESLIGTESPKSVTFRQFYDGTYQRAMALVDYSAEADATAALASLATALTAEGSGWSKAGTNSSGVVFYTNADGVTLYTGSTTGTAVDGSTTYRVYVSCYR